MSAASSTSVSILTTTAALLGALPAQEPVLMTATPCRAFAVSGLITSDRGLPRGFVVPHEVEVSAFAGGAAGAEVVARSQGARMHLDAACWGQSSGEPVAAGTANGNGVPAPHSWLWMLPGRRVGELRIGGRGSALPLVQGWIAIDVDADGTEEVRLNGSQTASVTIPLDRPDGAVVRVSLHYAVALTSAGVAYGSQSTTLAFVSSWPRVVPASFEPIDPTMAPRCGIGLFGADLPATDHVLRFTATGIPTGAPAWLVFGMQPLVPPYPLPGSPGCLLELWPIASLPGVVGPHGEAVWGLNVRPALGNPPLLAQAAVFDVASGHMRTSKGIRTRFFD